jgi:uncharacterized RDD family membrane protein YckC
LSTLASSPTPLPSWKQEVNRRLAEHKNRKGISVVDLDAHDNGQASSNSRAAAAAARVAARYAKTPSYSDMQAAEARGALRAAEAATRVALEAQAAAQAVLDQIQNNGTLVAEHEYESPTARTSENQWPTRDLAGVPQVEAAKDSGIEIRWEPDMPVRQVLQQNRAISNHPWETSSEIQEAFDGGYVYESVEAAQDIPANLIEFPREIVATRRMRPRITEAEPDSTDPQQLSIFEVEPNSVSTEPMSGSTATTEERTWIGSSWQQIELDEQPQQLPDYYAIVPDNAVKLYQAPFGRRMMATLVDTALVLSLVCGLAYLVASRFDNLPGIRASEVCGAIAVLGLAALYEWFFLTFAKVTPGMRYAQLSLCTFEEEVPNAAQVKARLKAMLISVLPLGLGVVWSIFDEDQMSWHDRLSKTYLRLS